MPRREADGPTSGVEQNGAKWNIFTVNLGPAPNKSDPASYESPVPKPSGIAHIRPNTLPYSPVAHPGCIIRS